ncbi:MAG TPA: hypothetical protein VHL11_06465, partial [Phototrophicaceae bacterium]|nr:hypothetical protein [Phototrophicaceae bacterium]
MDSVLTLAFTVQKNPGVYALLLGSGISRSSGIPTGWEIKEDLARQIKVLNPDENLDDLGYDDLLKMLGRTEAER